MNPFFPNVDLMSPLFNYGVPLATVFVLWLLYCYSASSEWKTTLKVGQIWEFPGRKDSLEVIGVTTKDVVLMRWSGPYQMGKEQWTIAGFRQFIKDRKLRLLP